MRDNPYKDLPPLERRPDGSLYRAIDRISTSHIYKTPVIRGF